MRLAPVPKNTIVVAFSCRECAWRSDGRHPPIVVAKAYQDPEDTARWSVLVRRSRRGAKTSARELMARAPTEAEIEDTVVPMIQDTDHQRAAKGSHKSMVSLGNVEVVVKSLRSPFIPIEDVLTDRGTDRFKRTTSATDRRLSFAPVATD
jgi:hypothetical protein